MSSALGTGSAAEVATPGLSVRCRGVVHLYRTFAGHDVVALRGVDLDVGEGERVAFLGPSGSGKSTLLTLLGAIQRPSAGKIFLGEHEVSAMAEKQLSRLRAGHVSTLLQGATRNLLPYATARQNLSFARLAMRPGRGRPRLDHRELLARMGLEKQADQVVSTMSGGQRQRLALCCAVASNPRLLLADEPTSQLGHADRDAVLELIHGVGDWFGTTILVVTHQPEVAATFPRTIRMLGGRVGSEGRDGTEYVVMGTDGVLHLPVDVAVHWPPGTLVQVRPDSHDRVLLSRQDASVDGTVDDD